MSTFALLGFIAALLLIAMLLILFWPRKPDTVRRITRSYNGQEYGRRLEKY